MIIRVVGALIMGGLVGFEREQEQKPAGLRTIMLVTLGSTLLLILAQRGTVFLDLSVDMVSMDPTRILGSLVQGVGFLGAGTIFFHRHTVHGLTTAAAIWTMAVVGAAIGVGDWGLAIVGTIAAYFILRILGKITHRIEEAHKNHELQKERKDKSK